MNKDDAITAITVIDHITNKLAGPAQHVYQVYINQALVEGLISLTIAIVLILMVIAIWVIFTRGTKIDIYDEEELSKYAFLFITTLLLSIPILLEFTVAIKALANPEYWAINKLLSHKL